MEVGSRLEGSYAMAMKIWIDRFKESQKVLRELENSNEKSLTLILALAEGAGDPVERLGKISQYVASLLETYEPEPEESHDHPHG